MVLRSAVIGVCALDRDNLKQLGDYVARVRKAKRLSLPAIKKRGGPAMSTVNALENGGLSKMPQPETLEKLARGLGVDYWELMRIAGYSQDQTRQEGANHGAIMVLGPISKNGHAETGVTIGNGRASVGIAEGIPTQDDAESWGEKVVPFPVWGSAACGDGPNWGAGEQVDTLYLPESKLVGVDMAIRVRGTSMSGYGINDGDDVLVKRVDGEAIPSGKPVLLCVNGEFIVKMLRRDEGGEFLEEYVAGNPTGPQRWKSKDGDAARGDIVGLVLRSVTTRMW